MVEYMTEQRRKLIDFFDSNPDKQFSVREIMESLSDENISESALYRNLSRLEKNGEIVRTLKKGRRESYYSRKAVCCRERIHLTCMKCGESFHMDSALSQHILDSVISSDGFSIDKCRTVFYGICKDCN